MNTDELVTTYDMLDFVARQNPQLKPLEDIPGATHEAFKLGKQRLKVWDAKLKSAMTEDGLATFGRREHDFDFGDVTNSLRQAEALTSDLEARIRSVQEQSVRRDKDAKRSAGKAGGSASARGKTSAKKSSGTAGGAIKAKKNKKKGPRPLRAEKILSANAKPVLSVHLNWAKCIMQGTKTWEIRSSNHKKHVGKDIYIHTTKASGGGCIIGMVHFERCFKATEELMNNNTEKHGLGKGWAKVPACCNRLENLHIWEFNNPRMLPTPISGHKGSQGWSVYDPTPPGQANASVPADGAHAVTK